MIGSSVGRGKWYVAVVTERRQWIMLGLAVAGLFASGFAHALGLGQATVNSYLDQPLNARIDLISRSEAEMATVTAGMASPADFQVIGLTRDALGIPIEFTVSRDLADPHIRLTSTQIMREPVLQLVVEVVWSSGRMLRQYTLFFDPPSFAAPAPLPAMPQASSRQPVNPGSTGAPQKPVPEAGAAPVEQTAPAITAVESPSGETTPFTADAGPPFDPVLTPADAEPAPLDRASDQASVTEPSGAATDVAEAVDAPAETAPDALETPVETMAENAVDPMPVEEVIDGSEPLLADVESITVDDTAAPEVALAGPVVPEPEEVADLGEALVENAPETADVIDESTAEAPPADEPQVAEADTGASAEEPVVPQAAVEEPEPVTVAEAELPEPVYRAVIPDAGVTAGSGIPDQIDIVRGDTLWDLSQEIAAERGVSVNQVMLAVQQSNPQAFLDDNINRMLAGEVLRVPQRDDMLAISARDAMLEVMRQEALYRTRWDIPTNPNDIPIISDLAQEVAPGTSGTDSSTDAGASSPEVDSLADADADTDAEAGTESGVETEEVSLVLVPPSARDDEMAEGMGQGSGGTNEASEGIDVVEELARTQEELANARQENSYLAERISELESALEQDQLDDGQGVADNNLAEMEDRLRDERLNAEPEPEIDFSSIQPESWLSRFGLWLGVIFIVLTGAVVVFLRSRRGSDPGASAAAESGGLGAQIARDSMSGIAAASEPDTEAVEMSLADPEARLDLARAYAAMGRDDKARTLLESVVQDGSATQEREAREMLSEL